MSSPAASIATKRGDTTVRLCAGGVASTQAGEVRKGVIRAQRLLLLLGLEVMVLLAAIRQQLGR